MNNVIYKLKQFGDFLYNKRYIFALIIFVICLLFKVNGSSIELWKNIINTNNTNGVILGISRGVRSDEWAVLTPMFISQVENGFNYFSTSLRATNTDVFMVYALPVLSIFQIYRPFLLGFIFFGSSRGLSFFWCGRLIALFLITFDLCMILTNKNKLLSYIGAIMITLSPLVQWWFSVNGIAEIFIFGELAIIMLYKYLNTNILKKRIIYLLLILICAGGYVLVLYPSWQIPMIYVFLSLAIWVIIKNRKNSKITKKDIISIIFTLALFLISMFCILSKSSETIKIVSNTVYPGSRFETGGGQFKKIFTYISNIYLSIKGSGLSSNQSETALMFGLFPVGLILAIRNLIISKKKDILLILLLISYIFLGTWCIFGFPKILAKITLMYNSQASRCLLALGYLDILLLIRSLSINDKKINKLLTILITVLLSFILVMLCIKAEPNYLTKSMIICMTIMCLYLIYFSINYNNRIDKLLFALGITFVMIISGLLVNPIRIGTESITDSEILKNVKKINKTDEGIWISEGYPFPVNNYIIMSGVPALNSTNTYPDLKKWYKIDENKKYENIYNRYAHININIIENDNVDKFILIQSDLIEINLTLQDLKTLNIKYVFTINDLEKYSIENINFNKIYNYNDYKIYKVIYK